MEIMGVNWPRAYSESVIRVAQGGIDRLARGTKSTELRPVMVRTADTSARFVVVPGRGVNHCFSLAETVSILAAHNSVEYLAFYNSNVRQFSADGLSFEGHYGERLMLGPDQLARAVEVLKDDRGSRQALLCIWMPSLDCLPGRKDYPCNVMAMLKAGPKNTLACHVIRRSSDLIWGAPHDHVVFTVIHDVIARSLGMATGEMTETCDSLHYYLDLYDDALNAVLVAASRNRIWACSNGRPDLDLTETRKVCRDIVTFDLALRADQPTLFARARQEQLRLLTEYGTTWWCDAFMVMMAYHCWKAKRFRDFIRCLEHVSVTFRSCLFSTFEPRVAARAKELDREFVRDYAQLTMVCASENVAAREEST